MQAQLNITPNEIQHGQTLDEWLITSDLPEELKQDIYETEKGIGLGKIYSDFDEFWEDLMNVTNPDKN